MSKHIRHDTNLMAFSVPLTDHIPFSELYQALLCGDEPSAAKCDAVDITTETYICDVTGQWTLGTGFIVDRRAFSDAGVQEAIKLARAHKAQQIVLVNDLGECIDVVDDGAPVWVGYWQETAREPDVGIMDYFTVVDMTTKTPRYYVADRIAVRGAKKRAVNI